MYRLLETFRGTQAGRTGANDQDVDVATHRQQSWSLPPKEFATGLTSLDQSWQWQVRS